MLHILCEDSLMGYTFWKAVNRILLNEKAHMHTSCGIDNMENKLYTLSLTSKDTLYCVIDLANTKSVYLFKEALQKDAKIRGYNYIVTRYNCVEEVFLSFVDLANWLRISDTAMLNALSYTRDYIYKRGKVPKSFAYLGYPLLKSAFPEDNEEQLASHFLSSLTHSYPYRSGFAISKKKLGPCWTCECKDLKQYPYYCQSIDCYLYYKAIQDMMLQFLTSKGKLEYLWNNSILAKLEPSIEHLKSLCEGD